MMFDKRNYCAPPKWFGGFTLVELLIVISVISILVTFGFTTYAGAQGRSRDLKRKQDLANIVKGLELYYQANGRYPTPGDWQTTKSGTWLASDFDASYMTNLPVDPLNTCPAFDLNLEGSTSCFIYRYGADATHIPCISPTGTATHADDGKGYLLEARMENANDQDNHVTTAQPCNSGATYGPITGSKKGVYILMNP